MRKLICRLGLALAVFNTMLVGCRGGTASPEASTATAGSTEGLAALVNGQPITVEDYQKQIAQVEAFFQQEGLDVGSEEGWERLVQVRRQVLEQMIDQELITQAAVEMDISISDSELESKIEEIIEQSGGQEQFQQSLQDTATSYDDFRQMLLDQLLSEAVFSAVTVSIPSVAEQVHARHILLSTKGKAEEVLARFQGGEDFAFLARECSEDVSSRERGGDMGFFPRGTTAPEIEQAAFSLEVGKTSGIIESQFGFHIVQVLERQQREIAPEILENLRQQSFMQWLQERRGSSIVERFVE